MRASRKPKTGSSFTGSSICLVLILMLIPSAQAEELALLDGSNSVPSTNIVAIDRVHLKVLIRDVNSDFQKILMAYCGPLLNVTDSVDPKTAVKKCEQTVSAHFDVEMEPKKLSETTETVALALERIYSIQAQSKVGYKEKLVAWSKQVSKALEKFSIIQKAFAGISSGPNFPFGVQPITVLAGAYESRAAQIARLFVPLASFSGDSTSNISAVLANSNNPNSNVPFSADLTDPTLSAQLKPGDLAILDTPLNTAAKSLNEIAAGVTAKPLVIKVKRDPFTGEVTGYGVFNSDGSVPGQAPNAKAPLYIPGQSGDPFDASKKPRYLVNTATGQIYLNSEAGINGVAFGSGSFGFSCATQSSNGSVQDSQSTLNQTGSTGSLSGQISSTSTLSSGSGSLASGSAVQVGDSSTQNLQSATQLTCTSPASQNVVNFSALNLAQQQASELSAVIQNLSSLIRGFRSSERTMLDLIR